MPRIRTVKPAFFRHRALYDLEVATQLPLRVAFEGLWTVADREGRFLWRPDELKLDCLPWDPVDFRAVLAALVSGDFVRGYIVEGKTYGYIPSWSQHQVIGNREAKSVLPDPKTGECLVVTPQLPVVTKHAQGEGKGREGKGKEGNRKGKEMEGKGKRKATSTQTDLLTCSETLTRSEPATPADVVDRPGGLVTRTTTAVRVAPAPIVLSFPTVGGGPSAWHLGADLIAGWQRAFPALDVIDECRRAGAWLDCNPTKKKTPRGMPRFLYAWLARSTNTGVRTVPMAGELQKSKLTRALEKASDW